MQFGCPETIRRQAVSSGIGIGGCVQRLMQIAHEMNDELEFLCSREDMRATGKASAGLQVRRHYANFFRHAVSPGAARRELRLLIAAPKIQEVPGARVCSPLDIVSP